MVEFVEFMHHWNIEKICSEIAKHCNRMDKFVNNFVLKLMVEVYM